MLLSRRMAPHLTHAANPCLLLVAGHLPPDTFTTIGAGQMQIPSVDEHMNHVRPIHVQARAYCTKDVSVRTMDAIKNIVVVY